MTLDLNKPLQLRCGKKVIFARMVNDGTDYPLFVLYENGDGMENYVWVRADGQYICGQPGDEDLINAPVPEYRLVYEDGAVVPAYRVSTGWEWHTSKEFAAHSKDGRAGYLVRLNGKITYEPIV